MGAYLSQPILDKETEDGGDESVRWGAASMQGWRTGQEDSHMACLDLRTAAAPAAAADPSKKIAAFAVFDGHGGAEVAKFCSAHICDVVKDTQAFKEGNHGLGLKETFLKMDDMLRSPAGQAELHTLKKASKGGDSDSDDGEEVVDMDMLSKMNPETQMQIMEQMKLAMRDQFRSGGKLGAEGDDDDSEHDDDSKYSSESDDDEEEDEEEEEEAGGKARGQGGDKDGGDKEQEGGQAAAVTADVAGAAAGEGAVAGATEAAAAAEGGGADGEPKEKGEAEEPSSTEVVVKGGAGVEGKGDAEEADATAEEWANGGAAGADLTSRRRCGFDCGATAVMGLLLEGKTLVVANAGDSRCVVSRKGVAVDMSVDHKPEDDVELARIEKAGGAVVDGRVQGNLNLSRAIGDLMYKADEDLSPEEQMITADPDLKTLELSPDDEFIVLACDGVWNSLSSQETIDFVRARLKDSGNEPPLSKTCSDLCDACCADTADGDGTGLDNVTVVIVQLTTDGARALTGSGGGGGGEGEGSGSGDMDTSDDGKRKQGGGEAGGDGDSGGGEEGGEERRSKKQMKAALAQAAAGDGK